MRDIGMNRQEAWNEVVGLTRLMRLEGAAMEERRAEIESKGGSAMRDPIKVHHERAMIELGARRDQIVTSGVFPWQQTDRGNLVSSGDVWARRALVTRYDTEARVDGFDKAIVVEVEASPSRYVLTFASVDVARRLRDQLAHEIARWDEDEGFKDWREALKEEV